MLQIYVCMSCHSYYASVKHHCHRRYFTLTTSAFALMQKASHALNEGVSLPSQDPILLTFEEDESETSELTVTRVSRFEKSANGKVSQNFFFFFIMLVCILFPSLRPVMFFCFLFLFCQVLLLHLQNTILLVILSLLVFNICVLISD